MSDPAVCLCYPVAMIIAVNVNAPSDLTLTHVPQQLPLSGVTDNLPSKCHIKMDCEGWKGE